MSRNKKTKKVYTVKDVFDHYEKHRIPGGHGEAWEEYERLNEGCNHFKEHSKENEQKLQRILKDARKRIPKYPGILSEEVKRRWKNLYEFLIGASKTLDLSDVWPKFDLITSIACIMDNEAEAVVRNIDQGKQDDPIGYHQNIPNEPRSRNEFYSLPDDGDAEKESINREPKTNHVKESRPMNDGYRENNRTRPVLQSDLRYDWQGGSEPRPVGGVYESKEKLIRQDSCSIKQNFVKNNEEDGFDFEDSRQTSIASNNLLSQLYNREWSEAYKLLKESGMEESDIQQLLCDLLHKSYDHCKQLSERRSKIYAEIKKLMVMGTIYPFAENSDDEQDGSNDSGHIDFIDRQHSELCERLSREYESNTIRSMCKILKDESVFLRRNKLKFYSEALRQYVDKCVETSWTLCTDTCPGLLVFCEQGTAVDKDLFSFYGSIGDTVRTCVWPAVTTAEGGTVLDKGIVAPFSNKDDKISQVSN